MSDKLIECAGHGNLQYFQRLLVTEKHTIDKPNRNHKIPLCWAIRQRDKRIVAMLLAAGADPDVCDRHGSTPLYWALVSVRPQNKMVKMLLDANADPNKIVRNDNLTALALAVVRGYTESVGDLLAAGARITRLVIVSKLRLSYKWRTTKTILFDTIHARWHRLLFIVYESISTLGLPVLLVVNIGQQLLPYFDERNLYVQWQNATNAKRK